MAKYVRPTWDEYFMGIKQVVSKRATCGRGRSACVIVKDKHIVATGYVGAPSGLASCDDVGHFLQEVKESDGSVGIHCIRTVHAEQNAICQAAKLGTPIKGATLYCTMTPCRTCAMLIIQCGISSIICERHYPHATIEDDTLTMLSMCGVSIKFISDSSQEYEEAENEV